LDFPGPNHAKKRDGADKPLAWVNEGKKFFQPRRYDKTKAQLAFCQQLARRSRPAAKNRPPACTITRASAVRANKNPPRMCKRRV
jgi:hypothetical protein